MTTEGQTITTRKGHTIGFSQYGDTDGLPLAFFHGTPGSRLLGRMTDGYARDAGFHVIALDRPGYGLSSFQRDRRLIDHADDVADVCDHLGVDRFAVVGISGGSPYVFACAAALPERVTAGAVISGFFGCEPPVDIEDFEAPLRARWEAVRADPEASRQEFDLMPAMLEAIKPREFFQTQLAESPAWVREIIEKDPSIAENFVEHHLEGLRGGSDGAVHELWLEVQPWGIDVSSIVPEIRFWHGGRDGTPRSHVEAVARELPRSEISWHEDCGHADCFFFMPEILAWLASAF